MSDRKRIDESEQLPSERVGLLAHGFAARSGDEMERGFVSRPTEQTALLQPYRVAPLIKQPGSATFLPLVVIACIGMFLYEMQLSGWHWQPFTANPFAGPGVNVLRKLGAKDPTVHEGQYHRLFMTMFLHAGVIHLLTNMLSLANVGFPLERMYGSARVAVIYLVSGVSAALSSSLFLPNTVSVGASGAATMLGLFHSIIISLCSCRCHLWAVGSLVVGAAVQLGTTEMARNASRCRSAFPS